MAPPGNVIRGPLKLRQALVMGNKSYLLLLTIVNHGWPDD